MSKKVITSTMLSLLLVLLTRMPKVLASPSPESISIGYAVSLLSAAIVMGAVGVAVAMAMGTLGSASAGAMAEKPELFSKLIVFIVFLEAIAIYALTLGFMILMKL
jgi:F0F1-type ATP synthase membrane subunit c/vacuolar-type H+-ATPase subunit K